MLTILLWGAIFVLGYIYVGYPAAAILLARIKRRTVEKRDATPSVTVIIAAFNEEKHIEDQIRNVLALDYPQALLDIIIASDASTDKTEQIVASLGVPNLRLLRVEGRQGKTACQNVAADMARGQILLFTDATTHIDTGALKAIMRNFNDPSVGCVAGRLKYLSNGDSTTEMGGTTYWNYEITLRLAESDLGSLIGVSGCLYAVRRTAYQAIDPNLTSDFVIAMVVREQGLRTVLEPDAVCYEYTLERPARELSMRVRVIMQSLSALAAQKRFLNPRRFGLFAWQLWSHKVFRYLSPVFWMTALAANVSLAMLDRYVWLLALQLAVLGAGALGFASTRLSSGSRFLAKPYYFLLTNLASAVSLIRFARGDRVVTWTPVR